MTRPREKTQLDEMAVVDDDEIDVDADEADVDDEIVYNDEITC